MVDVGFDEALLLFRGRVTLLVAGVRGDGIVVVVCPLSEVVGELEAGRVGCGVLEINDDKLLMLVSGLQ